jgi:hypothetical protein
MHMKWARAQSCGKKHEDKLPFEISKFTLYHNIKMEHKYIRLKFTEFTENSDRL